MIRTISCCASIFVTLNFLLPASLLFAQSVAYDCPAVVAAEVLEHTGSNQLVDVQIPISVSNSDARLQLQEVKVDVFWNRNAFPVVDYAPRTQLHSRYDGPITIEKKSEVNYGVSVSAASDYLDFVTPNAEADVGKKNSESRKYNEIPQQELLLASGTSRRGTGAFFTFKESRIQTLEGDRNLALRFDVPVSWRGGILQVTVRTKGRRKKFAGFHDDFELARTFMLPVYVESDGQARSIAYQFARTEQQLRYSWDQHLGRQDSANNQFQRWFATQKPNVPSLWVHQLIQSDSDDLVRRFEKQLPSRIAITANEFVDARKNLVAISE